MRTWRVVVCLALCLPLAGCFPSMPRGKANKPRPAAPAVDLPDQVETGHPRIGWLQPQPSGGLWREMEVVAQRGTVDPGAQSGMLHDARGTLYVKNVARATFVAPLIEARRDRSVIVAPQGARLKSIAPPGITVVADRVTWNADVDRITAEGNVRFVQKEPRTGRLIAWGGPFQRIVFDTGLQRLQIPAAQP